MNTNRLFKVWVVSLFLLAMILPGAYAVGQLLSPREGANVSPVLVYDATAAREASINYPKFPTMAHLQVYDATGVKEAAVVYSNEIGNLRSGIRCYRCPGSCQHLRKLRTMTHLQVYDATGVREAAIVYANELRIQRPVVYDATGAMLEAVVFPTFP